MKAFVHRFVDGRELLGTENGWVTNEYKTQTGLLKAVWRRIKTGETVKVEIHNDWNTRYGTPSFVLFVTKPIGKTSFSSAVVESYTGDMKHERSQPST